LKLSLRIPIRTAKQRLWEVILYPERFPSFVPDVRDVSVLQRTDLAALLQWRITIEGVPVQWTEQCRYDPQNARIMFHATRGDFASYDGFLSIVHAGGKVELQMEIDIDWGLPSFQKVISQVVEAKVRRSFMGMLVAIKRYAEKTSVKRNYAFVIHPLDLDLISIAFNEPNITSKRVDLMSKAFEWLPPFKCSDITGLKAFNGKETDGALIYCPLLPEQMVANNGEIALKRTIEAVKVAESLGVGIVGLGAYAAQIGRKGVMVSEAVSVPVTTGTSYTIVTAINGVERACELVGLDLKGVRVGIVGATGGIGNICAELLAGKVGGLVLNARNRTRLTELESRLAEKVPGLEITQTTELDWLIANSDVIITSTNTPSALIDARSLNPGTIVCDVSRPRNVSPESVREARGAVLVFDGGIVKPPGTVDFDFYFGLPPGIAYACMAETMILALSERYEGFSIGGNLTPEKAHEIGRLGDALGFRLSELRWCEQEVSKETIEIVREHVRRRSIGTWV